MQNAIFMKIEKLQTPVDRVILAQFQNGTLFPIVTKQFSLINSAGFKKIVKTHKVTHIQNLVENNS